MPETDGLVVDGRLEQIPGLEIVSYKRHPELRLKADEDMRARRTRWIRSFVWHNTKARPTRLLPGKGPSTDLGSRIANLWSTDGRHAGAHLSIDWDGAVCCHADLLRDAAYHASSMNEVSIGAELFEGGKGEIYEVQLDAALVITEWVCARFGIQRQIPDPEDNSTIRRIVRGGKDAVGIFGHCHQYAGKKNDPGKHIFRHLETAGFRVFDFASNKDRDWWAGLQAQLGVDADGIPGPITCDALRAEGYLDGLWRPPESPT